ncbi:LytR C-terminal domain-containing protein [uncultured Jatrophihabitans sp.]|uniref:LytR C-terminal domain-containing protein n=1 Tax=uncultured Jatrophihabitans sp. TaxID=1610747 RepID=UPI0035CC99CD
MVGVVVLIVAVVALRDPKSDIPSDAGKSVSISGTVGAPSSSRSATRTPAPTTSGPTSAAPVSLSGSGTTASTTTAAGAVPLVVLNNTTIAGLAKQAAIRFEAGGWTVTSSGNLTNNIVSTCAYYDPSVSGAKAAAEALRAQYPTIKRVEPKFAELPSGPVVVVLTPDYQSD